MILLFLKVRDEPDMVRLNLTHHLSWGFDHVLIADNESSGATLEVLQEFRDSVTVVRTTSPHDWGSALCGLIHKHEERYGSAGWVAVSDPDEFWWTPETPFAAVLGAVPDGVVAINSEQKLFLPTALDPLVGPIYCRHMFRPSGKGSPLHTSYLGGKSLYRVAWLRGRTLNSQHWSQEVPHGRVQFHRPLVHHYMIDEENCFVHKVRSIERWSPKVGVEQSGTEAPQVHFRDYKWTWWNIYKAEGDAGLRRYYRTKYLLSAEDVAVHLKRGELVHDIEFAMFKQGQT